MNYRAPTASKRGEPTPRVTSSPGFSEGDPTLTFGPFQSRQLRSSRGTSLEPPTPPRVTAVPPLKDPLRALSGLESCNVANPLGVRLMSHENLASDTPPSYEMLH